MLIIIKEGNIYMEWKEYPTNQPDYRDVCMATNGSYITLASFDPSTKLYNDNDEKYYGPAWHNEENGGILKDVIAFLKIEPYKKRKAAARK
jgi:hypothetical protein